MKSVIERRPFDRNEIEDVIAFSRRHGLAPFHPPALVRRFLFDLVSNPDLVLDLFREGERVATAVLLDIPTNGANAANLEVVGLKADQGSREIFSLILAWAKKNLPENRSSVDGSYHVSFPFDVSVFFENGFSESYSIYEMATRKPVLSKKSVARGFTLEPLSQSDFSEYHSVVLRAFAQNEDANIPPLHEMTPYLLKAKVSPGVVKHDGKIVGFYSVKIDDENPRSGEINTVGVLPEYRQLGLGRILLERAIERLAETGVDEFNLSVSAVNEKALTLYQQTGFEIRDKFTNFRFLK
jgi:ribosomal protein S18 acetylase RimI-like enzyme